MQYIAPLFVIRMSQDRYDNVQTPHLSAKFAVFKPRSDEKILWWVVWREISLNIITNARNMIHK